MPSSEELQAAFGYLFPDEVWALKYLARSLPPDPVVVNLGAGAGTSSLAFVESRPDLFLYTIDIQGPSHPFGCLEAADSVIKEAGHQLWIRHAPVLGDSKRCGELWLNNGGLLDMVFIDADHSYNGCKGDILAWLPNIKPGGIIAVHDYDKKNVYKRPGLPDKIPHPLPWPGVDRAVRKFLCPHYPMILHVDTLISFRVK